MGKGRRLKGDRFRYLVARDKEVRERAARLPRLRIGVWQWMAHCTGCLDTSLGGLNVPALSKRRLGVVAMYLEIIVAGSLVPAMRLGVLDSRLWHYAVEGPQGFTLSSGESLYHHEVNGNLRRFPLRRESTPCR